MRKYTTHVHTFEDMHTKKDCYVFASEVFTIVTAREPPLQFKLGPTFWPLSQTAPDKFKSIAPCTIGVEMDMEWVDK